MHDLADVFQVYRERALAQPPPLGLLVLAGSALVLGMFMSERAPRAAKRWVLALCLAVGLYRAFEQAACFDDAYISFRYAHNLFSGNGFVWNAGERVEGYTNFLWTLIVGALSTVTGIEMPSLAVALCLIVYVCNVGLVCSLSLRLWRDEGELPWIPAAMVVLALQGVFTAYATSGLETGFATLLVVLGASYLMKPASTRHAAAAGSLFILATLTRPDHSLFYVAGALVLFWFSLPELWRSRRQGLSAWRGAGLDHLLAYALAFLPYGAYLGWKLSYYGSLVPNTYYAKSAGLTNYPQGSVYALAFALSSHAWLSLPALGLWLIRSRLPASERRLRLFVLLACGIYGFYVIRVGGDFMHGRFFVPLIPLVALAIERAIAASSFQLAAARQGRRVSVAAAASLALLLLAAPGITLFPGREIRWGLADESHFYPIRAWFPLVIDHENYRVGKKLESLRKSGVSPVIAAGAIGMLGYYSELEVVDWAGLTDAHVAHLHLRKRGRPGHERRAPLEYLRARGVHFTRGGNYPSWFKGEGALWFGPGTPKNKWHIVTYDEALMKRIRELDPEIRFRDAATVLRQRLDDPPPDRARAARELEWFDHYYFDHNDAASLRGRFEQMSSAPPTSR